MLSQTESFEDSRRLTGPNRHFGSAGAVLETLPHTAVNPESVTRWSNAVADVRRTLGWSEVALDARCTEHGASLAMAAPMDQLYTATEVNEWVWQRANHSNDGYHAPGHPAVYDWDSALQTLRRLARAERNSAMMRLIEAAAVHGCPIHVDDEKVSLGEGRGSVCYPTANLPMPAAVPWSQLSACPKVLVSGSNGKTTSVRLLSAILRAHGWHSGHSCTDGLFIDGTQIEGGDYSGPSGARAILRHPQVEAAVLEAARGGLLRRGLAVSRADVALVTNVSADHFGEYGIHNLAQLAELKLTLARAIDANACLVLNADDAQLVQGSSQLTCPLAWFALDDAHPLLQQHRERGGHTAGVRANRLWLSSADVQHDLGDIHEMPLSLNGVATFNIANLAAAALSAFALGIAPNCIAEVLRTFGRERGDNPGRLQIWQVGGARVLLDYAHNPDGLQGLLTIARQSSGIRRLGLLLGQAGNRADEDVRALAQVAASFGPNHVVLKDIDGYIRGRRTGEIADLLSLALQEHGIAAADIEVELDEARAALRLLQWSEAGDLIVLPVHGTRARVQVAQLLDYLTETGWHCGQPIDAPFDFIRPSVSPA